MKKNNLGKMCHIHVKPPVYSILQRVNDDSRNTLAIHGFIHRI